MNLLRCLGACPLVGSGAAGASELGDLFITGFPPTSSRAREKSPLLLESVSHREAR